EGDHGLADDGNACSDEGNGSAEDGTGSTGVDDTCSATQLTGSGAGASCDACVEGAGSPEGSVGSDQGGKATSSTDSCACAARTAAKKIAGRSTAVLPTIM